MTRITEPAEERPDDTGRQISIFSDGMGSSVGISQAFAEYRDDGRADNAYTCGYFHGSVQQETRCRQHGLDIRRVLNRRHTWRSWTESWFKTFAPGRLKRRYVIALLNARFGIKGGMYERSARH